MKELSIEEKAKAYEEALERAQKLQETCYSNTVVGWMEYIFPELKESEGEKEQRIKNSIIKVLNNTPYSYEFNPDEAIAWLEKQGETFTKKDVEDAYLKGLEDAKSTEIKTDPCIDCSNRTANCHNFPCDVKKAFEKKSYFVTPEESLGMSSETYQKVIDECIFGDSEQKPAEWEPQVGDTFRKKGTTSPTYYLCDKREDGITFGFVENRKVGISGGEITIFALRQNYELVERPKLIEDVVEGELNKGLQTKVGQKPAWSEEDEDYFDAIIAKLEVTQEDAALTDNQMQFLKSLKGRVQTKQEVDEQIETIATHLDNCGNTAMAEILRSCNLHPRNRWKPSYEQMLALNLAIEFEDGDILKSLYDDLKKL